MSCRVNNVGGDGGAEMTVATLEERTNKEVLGFVDVNATFPTEITRVLLPLLRRQKSALIINIGSGVSEMAVPYRTHSPRIKSRISKTFADGYNQHY